MSIRYSIQLPQAIYDAEDALKLKALKFAIKAEFPDLYTEIRTKAELPDFYAEIGTDEIPCNQGFIVFLTLHGRDYQTKPAIIKTASIDETIATIREIVDRASQQEARS